MKKIKDLLSAEMLEPQTQGALVSTEVSEKFEGFETFADPQLVAMKMAAMQFATAMLAGETPRWLSLLGTSGAGKTMLARLITRIYRDKLDGKPFIDTPAKRRLRHGGFVTWRQLSSALREGEFILFDDVARDWFLCVDDIGSEHSSAFISAKLFELANQREKKWTIFTANLSLEQIAEVEARLASRMIRHGSVVVNVDVPDYNSR